MKRLLALSFLAFSLGVGSFYFYQKISSDRDSEVPPFEEKITFKGADWDSLATPLGIKAYYLKVQSKQHAKALSLEIDIYQNGTFIRTIKGVELGEAVSKIPLASEFALYLKPAVEGKVAGMIVMNCGSNTGTAPFTLDETIFPSSGGASCYDTFPTALETPRRNPVFYIVLGGAVSPVDNPEGLIEYNPKATIFIGYLNVE